MRARVADRRRRPDDLPAASRGTPRRGGGAGARWRRASRRRRGRCAARRRRRSAGSRTCAPSSRGAGGSRCGACRGSSSRCPPALAPPAARRRAYRRRRRPPSAPRPARRHELAQSRPPDRARAPSSERGRWRGRRGLPRSAWRTGRWKQRLLPLAVGVATTKPRARSCRGRRSRARSRTPAPGARRAGRRLVRAVRRRFPGRERGGEGGERPRRCAARVSSAQKQGRTQLLACQRPRTGSRPPARSTKGLRRAADSSHPLNLNGCTVFGQLPECRTARPGLSFPVLSPFARSCSLVHGVLWLLPTRSRRLPRSLDGRPEPAPDGRPCLPRPPRRPPQRTSSPGRRDLIAAGVPETRSPLAAPPEHRRSEQGSPVVRLPGARLHRHARGRTSARSSGRSTGSRAIPRHPVWQNHLTFTLARNRGGAWGLLQGASENVRRPFFLLVSVAAITFIVTLYRRLQPRQRALKWGLAARPRRRARQRLRPHPLRLGHRLHRLQGRVGAQDERARRARLPRDAEHRDRPLAHVQRRRRRHLRRRRAHGDRHVHVQSAGVRTRCTGTTLPPLASERELSGVSAPPADANRRR